MKQDIFEADCNFKSKHLKRGFGIYNGYTEHTQRSLEKFVLCSVSQFPDIISVKGVLMISFNFVGLFPDAIDL